MRTSKKSLAYIVLFVFVLQISVSAIASAATTSVSTVSTARTSVPKTVEITTAPVAKSKTQTSVVSETRSAESQSNSVNLVNLVKSIQPKGAAKYAIYVVFFGVLIALVLMIWFMPFNRKNKIKEYASVTELKPPKGYDFIAYVIDDENKTISKQKFIKISKNFFMSTSLTNPSFLFVPPGSETYLCKESGTITPCALVWRQGLLSMLVDPELASAETLASATKVIDINEEELDKMLSALYSKAGRKQGYIQIAPDVSFSIAINTKTLIKKYLRLLRSADELLVHFLQTAKEAESIERFMKTAAKMQEAKFSWAKWIAYLILSAAVAFGMLMMIRGGK